MAISDTHTQFNRISALIKNSEMAQALALLKPILAKEPRNVEAWWLAANAAPTPEASIQACELLLTIKPDYQPARKMITDLKLKEAAILLKQAQSAEALLLIRPIVAEQPDHVEALWLMARAVPLAKEAIETCLRILTLQPDHEGAKRLIATKQQNLAAADAFRQARRPRRRSRAWMVFGLFGIIALMSVAVAVALYIKGVGVPKTVTRDLGSIGAANPRRSVGDASILGGLDTGGLQVYTDSLPADGQHDYKFTASENSLFLCLVIFTTSSGNAGKSVTLLGPDGKQITSGDTQNISQKGMVFLQAELPVAGTYILRLKGVPNAAQGAYAIQMGVQSDAGMDFPNWNQ